jgi:hypothetical protein
MKTIEHVKKTIWNVNRRMFFTKKFQGIVFSIDCDVSQGWEYTTICVFTIKFLFVGMWISFDKKTLLFPRLSKYKPGGIIEGSNFWAYPKSRKELMKAKNDNQ